MMTDEERKIWLAVRKEAGLKIDPETAEVAWTYGLGDDPYECSRRRRHSIASGGYIFPFSGKRCLGPFW